MDGGSPSALVVLLVLQKTTRVLYFRQNYTVVTAVLQLCTVCHIQDNARGKVYLLFYDIQALDSRLLKKVILLVWRLALLRISIFFVYSAVYLFLLLWPILTSVEVSAV